MLEPQWLSQPELVLLSADHMAWYAGNEEYCVRRRTDPSQGAGTTRLPATPCELPRWVVPSRVP